MAPRATSALVFGKICYGKKREIEGGPVSGKQPHSDLCRGGEAGGRDGG